MLYTLWWWLHCNICDFIELCRSYFDYTYLCTRWNDYNFCSYSWWAILLFTDFHLLCYQMTMLLWWCFCEKGSIFSNPVEWTTWSSVRWVEMSCANIYLWQIENMAFIMMHLFVLYLIDFDDRLLYLSYLDFLVRCWRC